MLGIILGLISLALSVLLAVGIHSSLSFDIMSLSIFFIVPMGSIIIGGIASLGYYWGLFVTNKKIDSWYLLVGLMIPIIAYGATQYGYYATAYMDDNMTLNYKMEGEHISNFSIGDSDEPINFFSYTKLMVESQVITFTSRRHTLGVVEGNPVANWIFFIIDGLGSVFGSFMAFGLVVRNSKYCDECKRYMKQKSLFKFAATDLDRTIRFQDIDNLSPEKIKQLLPTTAVYDEEYYEVIVHWCETCVNGYLEMQYMEKNSKGNMIENDKKSKNFKISPNSIRALLELVP